MRTKMGPVTKLAAAIAVGVLLAAGCGGDSGGDAGADAVAEPARTTATAQPAATTAAPTTTAVPATSTPAPERIVLPGAVEGTLLEGLTPEGFTLQANSATTSPRPETCPGTIAYGGIVPVAYSEAVWEKGLIGPYIDAEIARFESPEAAAQALASYRVDLIACGEFPRMQAGNVVVGSFSIGEDPMWGEESFSTDYDAVVLGSALNRYGVHVRIGESLYTLGTSALIVDPDTTIVSDLIDTLLAL